MKASRWEILGAWLHIWTPPRDVEIPRVPRRAAAVVAGALAVVVIVVVTVIAPALHRSKDRESARQALNDADFVRREEGRLVADQRAHHARSGEAARRYAAGRSGAARALLLADVRRGVMADARARVAAGTFDTPVREVRCRYLPGTTAPRVQLSCLAITSRTAGATVGQPFVAVGSLRDGRYAWCHDNPRPGEGASGGSIAVALPADCTA
jgi:hypothetical protein